MHDGGLMTRLPKVRGVYRENEPLSRHTWFAVGGPAEVMFFPEDEADLSAFLAACPADVPVFVLGGGSNLLVRDGGIDGVTVKLEAPAFKQYRIDNDTITCGCGLRNVELQKIMINHGVGGLAFLSTIPGCIGGSVKTNAGCYGKETADVLLSATVIDRQGTLKKINVDDLHLSYRHSDFPTDWIMTAMTFKIYPEPAQRVLDEINDYKNRRLKTQPHHVKTAGSTFKNPAGYKAWELIKQAGCAGLAVGGAQVSEMHCNFLVNAGGASARDIETLGEEIVRRVRENSGVTLEWEVKRIGKEL